MGLRLFPTNDLPVFTLAQSRRSVFLRLGLALLGLALIALDPPRTPYFDTISNGLLLLYLLYGVARYIVAARYAALFAAIDIWSRWVDVIWFMLLIALNHGAVRLFFFALFFIALVTAFRWGLESDLRFIVIFAMLSLFVDVAFEPDESGFQLDRVLFHTMHVVLLGYMSVRWGIFEYTLKRRLALLREVTTLAGPRVGLDQSISRFMEQLREFYQASACLMVTVNRATGASWLRRTEPHQAGIARAEEIPAPLASQLLTGTTDRAIVYYGGAGRVRWPGMRASQDSGMSSGDPAALAELIEAVSFAAVPIHHGGEVVSRLYLISHRRRAFDAADAEFLSQAVEQFSPILENVRLIDQIAADAADGERRRIARDIHDSVVQSYIGVQIGLSALRQRAGAGQEVGAEIERLLGLVDHEISNVRSYIRGLSDSGGYRDSLLPSVHRFAQKFTEVTGIDVQIDAPDSLQIDERLAGELFQLIAEGLSNIRRHTQAKRATIGLAREAGMLTLRIANDGARGAAAAAFTPRSMTERALALGGFARVERDGDDRTAVLVDLPI
jgi:signal transduction histidine kinase